MVEKIIKIFEEKKEVRFKLFNLEYIIKEQQNKIAVYPLLYNKHKKYFNSLEDALNNYIVYGDRLSEIINRIDIID